MTVNERYTGENSYAIMRNSNSRCIIVTGSAPEGLYQHLHDMMYKITKKYLQDTRMLI